VRCADCARFEGCKMKRFWSALPVINTNDETLGCHYFKPKGL